ncbi:MAG: RDD family protein, partial [Burkholderiales bacterium]
APRGLAWAIDTCLRFAVLIVLSIVMSGFGGIGQAIVLITWFLLEWIVPAWCEVRWGGATPGKKAMKLVVVHDDGRPIRWPAALTRNLLRAVDFLPMLYGFGLLSTLINRDFKRIGDLAAGTIVVYREPVVRAAQVPAAPPVAPPAQLAVTEQRTIIDLAERMPALTAERAEELAGLAPTLAREGGAARLVGIANYLVGRGQAGAAPTPKSAP